ncbi:ap2 domain transcription factor ap2viib-2, partial [Cystoisospora suis]
MTIPPVFSSSSGCIAFTSPSPFLFLMKRSNSGSGVCTPSSMSLCSDLKERIYPLKKCHSLSRQRHSLKFSRGLSSSPFLFTSSSSSSSPPSPSSSSSSHSESFLNSVSPYQDSCISCRHLSSSSFRFAGKGCKCVPRCSGVCTQSHNESPLLLRSHSTTRLSSNNDYKSFSSSSSLFSSSPSFFYRYHEISSTTSSSVPSSNGSPENLSQSFASFSGNLQHPSFFLTRCMYTTAAPSSSQRVADEDLKERRGQEEEEGERYSNISRGKRTEDCNFESSEIPEERQKGRRERENEERRKAETSFTSDSEDRGGEHEEPKQEDEEVPRVYRQPEGMVQHVFQWGIGNAFRAINANRFRPVHAARPKEVSIHPSYFESPYPSFMIWEALNEAWEVYFYENFKKSAKPFPVKKFGIKQAKREALQFLQQMKKEGRLEKPRFHAEEGKGDGSVTFDQVTGSWVCRYFDAETGRGTSRAFGGDYHGFEEAKSLAIQRRRQNVANQDLLLKQKKIFIH